MGFVLPRYGISSKDVKMKLDEILENNLFSISWISRRMLAGVVKFIVEKKLSFNEFSDWIIAYDAYSRSVTIATFDKNLARKCRDMDIEIMKTR